MSNKLVAPCILIISKLYVEHDINIDTVVRPFLLFQK